jgi:hypothetical protein
MKESVSRCAKATSLMVLLTIVLVWAGCGGISSASGPRPGPTPTPSGRVPQLGHVVLVVEENHSYSEVIGNSAMPYLNSLASQYGLATQYYADTHPSIGNYFMLTTGQIVTNVDTFTGTVSVDNIVRELIASGKTWKSYAESIPSHGYTGGDQYPYAKRHNPCSYFDDVVNSTTQAQNLVSGTQFDTDVSNNQLPNFSFVAPNLLDDAHDGTLAVADAWLQAHIDPLIKSPSFQQDGLLIITFDESDTSAPNNTVHGGGQAATLIISSKARAAYKSTTLYQHESTLRLILNALSVPVYPGAASTAPDMGEFF